MLTLGMGVQGPRGWFCSGEMSSEQTPPNVSFLWEPWHLHSPTYLCRWNIPERTPRRGSRHESRMLMPFKLIESATMQMKSCFSGCTQPAHALFLKI